MPVDLEKQEEEKTERKRERNRIAATKCRKRKIQRINVLEDEVNLPVRPAVAFSYLILSTLSYYFR